MLYSVGFQFQIVCFGVSFKKELAANIKHICNHSQIIENFKTMKKNILHFFFLYLFLLILVSCDRDEQSLRVDSLTPINKGNSWTYKNTYLDYHVGYPDTTCITIGEKVTINGYTCYSTAEERPFHAKFLMGNDMNGDVVNYGGFSDNDTLISPEIEFKKDAKPGDEWLYAMVTLYTESGKFSKSMIPVKCLSVDTLITTPKGQFHCMVFRIILDSYSYKIYISMNVGQVRTEQYRGVILISYSELINYKIKW